MSAIPIPPLVDAALVDWAERLLIDRGAIVTWPADGAEYVTAIALYKSLPEPRLRPGVFYQRLRSFQCPKVPRRRSPGGRLLELAPTAELRRYLMQESQPGRKL